MLSSCRRGIFDPAGTVARSETLILLDSLAIMLAIILPVIGATLLFAWWFRKGNTRAHYRSNWAYSGRIELLVWSVPALVVMILGGIGWIGSHALDPAKPLESENKPLEVEVVSLDWKWLFIYPEQKIASVNRLVAPVGVPLHLRLTSASVMNVFYVPRVGSEIYTMYGMATQLWLQADKAGSYPGMSAHFSGDGFADMTFAFDTLPATEFSLWVAGAQAHGPALNAKAYQELSKQNTVQTSFTYRDVAPGLFDAIIGQHLLPGPGPREQADAR